MQRSRNVQRPGRRLFCGFEYDRTTRSDSAGNFAAGLAHREIPRRESGDRADRLVVYDIADARPAWNDAPVRAHRFSGIPFKKLTAADDLKLCLFERLAVFHGDGRGDFFLALAQYRCGLQ